MATTVSHLIDVIADAIASLERALTGGDAGEITKLDEIQGVLEEIVSSAVSVSTAEQTKLDTLRARLDDLKTLVATNTSTITSTSTAEQAKLDTLAARVDALSASNSAKLDALTLANNNRSTEEQTKLDGIRSSTDALNTKLLGDKFLGFVAQSVSQKVGQGKFFLIGGTQTLVGGLADPTRAMFQVENPPTSTKVLYIIKMTLYSDMTQHVHYYENATITDPTVVTPNFNLNRASANTSVAVGRMGTRRTGGLKLPNESRVGNVDALTLDFPPLVLPPGRSLLITGTSAGQQTLTVNLYWYEE